MSEIECDGWWQQLGFGKQIMTELRLRFDEGGISGVGTDVIGPFTFSGCTDAGAVTLRKLYTGRHEVYYEGEFDGEGTLFGTWHIGGDRGPWMIRLLMPRAGHALSEVKEMLP